MLLTATTLRASLGLRRLTVRAALGAPSTVKLRVASEEAMERVGAAFAAGALLACAGSHKNLPPAAGGLCA